MRRVVAVVAVACLLGSCASRPPAPRRAAAPSAPVVTPTPQPTPEPTPIATPAPTPRRTARPRVVRQPAPDPPVRVASDTSVFAGLGTWVDVFDIDDDPAKLVGAVRDMAARGVRTLYLESSRFDRPSDVENPHTVAAALREAHSLGMRVVAWYPPSFTDVDHDVRRTVAAVQYVSPAGDRFDGVAADIERTDVRDTADRNARLIDYSRRVRDQTGGMPLAAIVIPPTSLAYNPARWPEFPWANIAPSYDVFMPMNYWTYRKRDAETARTLTEQNMAETTRLTRRPVHIIGGEAAQADLAQVAAYVGAALQSGSIGGGLYDWFTTRAEVWDELRKLIG